MQAPEKLAAKVQGFRQVWRKFRLPIIGISVLLVVIAAILHLSSEWQARSAAESVAAVKQGAGTAAKGVSKQLKSAVTDVLKPVDDSTFSALLATGDQRAIEERTQDLMAASTLIKNAHLLPKGYSRADYKSNPPLGYATLELMRQAEKTGKRPRVEALFHGELERQHVALVEPLLVDDDVVGHIVLALDYKVIKQSLKGLKVAEGYAEVSQWGGEGKPVVLGRSGDRGARRGPPIAGARISGSAWRVRVWPAAKTDGDAEDQLMMVIAGAVLILLLVGGGLFFWGKRQAAAQAAGGEQAGSASMAGQDPLATKLAELRANPSAGTAAVEEEGLIVVEDESMAPPPSADGVAEENTAAEAVADTCGENESVELADELFRPCEIRGLADEQLTQESVYALGRAIGSEAARRENRTLVVACDGRASSPVLSRALSEGLRASGRDVIDIGQVPTPVMYYATKYLNTESGVMVTGSNGPAGENGLVVVLGGETLRDEALTGLQRRVAESDFVEGQGTSQSIEVIDEYVRRISEDIPVALGSSYRVVLDGSNGVAGTVAPKVMRALGHDVVELNCEVDASFPNHAPDPSDPDNLRELAATVTANEADIGFAFDGDGTRLGVVDAAGNVVTADRQMMLFAVDMLARDAGAQIVFDVKCSARLAQVIKAKGGKPVVSRTGHAYMKRRVTESDTPLAGEGSGRFYFKERWYGFDDAMYAASRMLEILMGLNRKPTEVFARLPAVISSPDKTIAMSDAQANALVAKLKQSDAFAEGKVMTVDGLRVDYPNGFGVVRASTARPALSIRFAANDETSLGKVKEQFRVALAEVAPDLELPF